MNEDELKELADKLFDEILWPGTKDPEPLPVDRSEATK